MKARIVSFCAILLCSFFVGLAADEITMTAYLKASKGYAEIIRSPGTLQVDWTGTRVYGPVVYTLNTTYVSMGRGSVATNGLVFIRHVGTSYTVDVSFDAGTNAHLRLNAGEFQMFRLNPTFTITGMMAKSSGTNDFEMTILED